MKLIPGNFAACSFGAFYFHNGYVFVKRLFVCNDFCIYRLPDDGRIEKLFERIPDALAEPPFEYKMPNYTKVCLKIWGQNFH